MHASWLDFSFIFSRRVASDVFAFFCLISRCVAGGLFRFLNTLPFRPKHIVDWMDTGYKYIMAYWWFSIMTEPLWETGRFCGLL